MAKRICSCFLALLLVFGLTGTVFAAEETDTLIPGFSFSLFEPDCGMPARRLYLRQGGRVLG